MFTLTLPENYGAVIALSLGAIPLFSWIHGALTSSLRTAAKVPYPHCYATVEQCKSNPKAEQFNCAQRAHANFLENSPQTMLYILISGLKYPGVATAIGSVWLISRALYLYGYVYSGKPQGKGRFWGSAFWLCQGALWALTSFGVARELNSLA
ncbi:hypothetical protein Egran_02693 [Elaphomyces granulatus]|uniref:Glutathione S-transferase n=1 Tax=Elaphomyces granulatus TaxID=519963 RepID=A0A232LZH0_9EURO|nr:hypothetical protein Egran_02693 [Elaphomyces granulatus]